MDLLCISPCQFNLKSHFLRFPSRFSCLGSMKNQSNWNPSGSTLELSIYCSGFHHHRRKVHGFCFCSRTHGSVMMGMKSGEDGFGEKRDDGYYIRRCVELARKAVGCTNPNPMVGCVIVKDGQIVGEGFHPKAGMPHAEVFALNDAGVLAENATAYVSLEPCNHYGRTPPCTEAFIRAKVKRVVVGMVDPNPIVASKGVERLRESGVEVTVGVEEELCQKLNEAYIHRMLTGKPFVTLRYSLSFNGDSINELGDDGQCSGGYYSALLQEQDGIIISSASLAGNTDFPASREPSANPPFQIIIVNTPNFPSNLPVQSTEAPHSIVFADRSTMFETEAESNWRRQGVEIVVMDQIDLGSILDFCSKLGLCSVLLDLRGSFGDFDRILEQGLEEGFVQKVVVELCPVWSAGEGSSSPALKKILKKTVRLKGLRSRISKNNVVIDGYIC